MSKVDQSVYLFFRRNCREAMEFYQAIFGGELAITTRGSVDPNAPAEMKELLIHSSLTGGDVELMAADHTEVDTGPQGRISISLTGDDEAKLRKIYDQLSAGGKADYPLKKEFWGDLFGSLVDRFGISWMITITAPAE